MDEKMKRILDPKIWEMSEEDKERARQHISDCYEKYESGMLTYEDAVATARILRPYQGLDSRPRNETAGCDGAYHAGTGTTEGVHEESGKG